MTAILALFSQEKQHDTRTVRTCTPSFSSANKRPLVQERVHPINQVFFTTNCLLSRTTWSRSLLFPLAHGWPWLSFRPFIVLRLVARPPFLLATAENTDSPYR
ncbi:unnamed protein product [Ectocarpus sp. 12 AP-2014]